MKHEKKSLIYDNAEKILDVFKDIIIENFDKLHDLTDKIPYKKFSDFCKTGLEAVLIYQDNLNINKILDVAIDGWINH